MHAASFLQHSLSDTTKGQKPLFTACVTERRQEREEEGRVKEPTIWQCG